MQEDTNNTATHAEEALETDAPAGADSEVADLQKQRDDLYDRLLRTSAEFDNYRKRIDRERQQSIESAASGILQELLPLVVDFERALRTDAGRGATDAYRQGVDLIHKQLLELLRRRGVRPIEALGEDFDPHFHQAVTYEPAEGRRDGEVIEEFRR